MQLIKCYTILKYQMRHCINHGVNVNRYKSLFLMFRGTMEIRLHMKHNNVSLLHKIFKHHAVVFSSAFLLRILGKHLHPHFIRNEQS